MVINKVFMYTNIYTKPTGKMTLKMHLGQQRMENVSQSYPALLSY